jgi:hypothetical protein
VHSIINVKRSKIIKIRIKYDERLIPDLIRPHAKGGCAPQVRHDHGLVGRLGRPLQDLALGELKSRPASTCFLHQQALDTSTPSGRRVRERRSRDTPAGPSCPVGRRSAISVVLLYRIVRYSGANGSRSAINENDVVEDKPDAASE